MLPVDMARERKMIRLILQLLEVALEIILYFLKNDDF